MGSYEQEISLVEAGKARPGKALRDYYGELDLLLPEEFRKPRPNHGKTLLAKENEDIYQEFCRLVDQTQPRRFEAIESPISIDGYTAADIHKAILANNQKLHDVDAAAVYSLLARLRTEPEVAKKVIGFVPSCACCCTVQQH